MLDCNELLNAALSLMSPPHGYISMDISFLLRSTLQEEASKHKSTRCVRYTAAIRIFFALSPVLTIESRAACLES